MSGMVREFVIPKVSINNTNNNREIEPLSYGYLKIFGDGYFKDKNKCYLSAIVAKIENENWNEYETWTGSKYAVISVINSELNFGTPVQFGDYYTVKLLDKEEYEEFEDKSMIDYGKKLYENFKAIHELAPYRIIGRKFSNEVKKDTGFPHYELLDEKEVECCSFDSLKDAAKFLFENEPEYYMGATIVQDCPSGESIIVPVPTFYERLYGKKDRVEVLEKIAEDNGWELDKSKFYPIKLFEEEVEENNCQIEKFDFEI